MHIYIVFIYMNLKVYLTFPFWQAFGYYIVMFRDSFATKKKTKPVRVLLWLVWLGFYLIHFCFFSNKGAYNVLVNIRKKT